jgi:hypothetical protein
VPERQLNGVLQVALHGTSRHEKSPLERAGTG